MAAAKTRNNDTASRTARLEEKLDAFLSAFKTFVDDSKENWRQTREMLNQHDQRIRNLEICEGGARMSLSLGHKLILTAAALFSIVAVIVALYR